MAEIRFYIPDDETIPTQLRVYVDNVFVRYKRIEGGFRFYISLDDEQQAIKVAKQIIQQMQHDHDYPQHGVSWVTISLEVVPQDERYRINTVIDWKYRVRDAY